MPIIEFTATPMLPHDIADIGYKAGTVVALNEASARRWVRRGVAIYVDEAVADAAADAVVEPVSDEVVVDVTVVTSDLLLTEDQAADEPVVEPIEPDIFPTPRRGRPRK